MTSLPLPKIHPSLTRVPLGPPGSSDPIIVQSIEFKYPNAGELRGVRYKQLESECGNIADHDKVHPGLPIHKTINHRIYWPGHDLKSGRLTIGDGMQYKNAKLCASICEEVSTYRNRYHFHGRNTDPKWQWGALGGVWQENVYLVALHYILIPGPGKTKSYYWQPEFAVKWSA